jgi:hypothetical protein
MERNAALRLLGSSTHPTPHRYRGLSLRQGQACARAHARTHGVVRQEEETQAKELDNVLEALDEETKVQSVGLGEVGAGRSESRALRERAVSGIGRKWGRA